MADPFNREPQGAFLSFLDWLDKPGQVVRNLITGRPGAAARHAGDAILDVLDAPLPGDWFGRLATAEDKVSGADLVGIDKAKDPILGTITDIGLGVVTDPWSAVPGAAVLKGLRGAQGLVAKGVAQLPRSAQDALQGAKLATKETLGWLDAGAHSGAVSQARALEGTSRKAGAAEIERFMAGLPGDQRQVVGDVIDNLKWQDDGVQLLRAEPGRRAGAIESVDQQIATLNQRLLEHPAYAQMDEASRAQVQQALGETIRFGQRQFREAVEGGALERPVMYHDPLGKAVHKDELLERFAQERGINQSLRREAGQADAAVERLDAETLGANRVANAVGGAPPDPVRRQFGKLAGRDARLMDEQADLASAIERMPAEEFEGWLRGQGFTPQAVDISAASPRNYLQRLFSPVDELAPVDSTKGRALPSAIKDRAIRSDEQLRDFLNSEQGRALGYERDALKRLSGRADQQGKLLAKAAIGREILGSEFIAVADAKTRGAVAQALETMQASDPEAARVLANAWNGAAPRGPVLDVLAKANRFWKPLVVYGAVIPKLNSVFRNAIGGSWQTLSVQGPGAAGKQLLRTPGQLWGAIDDGIVKAFGIKRLSGSEVTRDLDLIEQAFRQSGGTVKGVDEMLAQAGRADLAEAVRNGVLDSFVSSEDLLKQVATSPRMKKALDLWDAPGAIFQGLEQRMRLANYLDQLKGGTDAIEAAKRTRESFLDYSVTSGKNRTLRDLVPFAAFLTGSVKQQAKFLASNPAVAVGVGQALNRDPEVMLPPYLDGKFAIPLSTNEDGERVVASGFGLPFEALSVLPNPSANLRDFGRDVERGIVGSSQPLLKTAYAAVSGEDPYFESAFGSYDKIPVVGSSGALGRFYNQAAGTGALAPIDTPLRIADDLLASDRGVGAKALDFFTGMDVKAIDEDRVLSQRLTQTLASRPDVLQARTFIARDDPEAAELIKELRAAKARIKARRDAAAVP